MATQVCPPYLLGSLSPMLQICARCQGRLATSTRTFSSTLRRNVRKKERQAMFKWLAGPGAVFKDALPGSTNYLSAYDASGNLLRAKKGLEDSAAKKKESEDGEPTVKTEEDVVKKEDRDYGKKKEGIPVENEEDMVPFPANRQFRSQAVLSEELKEVIWHLVTQKGASIRRVSSTYHVDMRRVAAVVRLKEVEKQRERDGKRLATPYNRAILAMLPQTPFMNPPKYHEPINDLPVHRATVHQLFHPVSESRHFTRVDAGRAFDAGLLPADERINHPQLIAIEKAQLSGRIAEDSIKAEWEKAEAADAAQVADIARRKRSWEDATKTISTERWDFKFQDVRVDTESVGRHVSGIGQRYGVPPQDRKKGQVKIPTRVG